MTKHIQHIATWFVIFMIFFQNAGFLEKAKASTEVFKDQQTPSSTSNGKSPIMFIENKGQFAKATRFQVNGNGNTMWLTDNAIWWTTLEETTEAKPAISLELPGINASRTNSRKGASVKLSFPGANPHPRLEPYNRLGTSVNYFLGNQPEKWTTQVPTWGGVRYKDIYPGIDLEISSENGKLVQRLVARQGANLEAVQIQVDGAQKLVLSAQSIQATTSVETLTIPLFELVSTSGKISSAVRINGNRVYLPFSQPIKIEAGQALPAANDLAYATFLGGAAGAEWGNDIDVDTSGNAYIVGYTDSTDMPTTVGAFDTTVNVDGDAFVAKLNDSGSGLEYLTILGGDGNEYGNTISVDKDGSAYIAGPTNSTNFPTTPGTFDTSGDGTTVSDCFVAKLNSTGSALEYSTYLGGNQLDYAMDLATDNLGQAYILGETDSNNFPTTPGAFDRILTGTTDTFIAKMNTRGNSLIYSTLLGGSGGETGYAIEVDANGKAYLAGTTSSTDFPTTVGAFDTIQNGSGDVFITKLNAAGSALEYSTYLGGSDLDQCHGMALDSSGAVYVTGSSDSTDFPTTAGVVYEENPGNVDSYITKLNPAGAALEYSTYIGGITGREVGWKVRVDSTGSTYLVGTTYSSDFPVSTDALDTFLGGFVDAFFLKLNPAGTAVTYATFLGGGNDDEGLDLAIDASKSAYITGLTKSADFPTSTSANDTSYNGGYSDVFIVKLTGEAFPFVAYLPLVIR